MRKITSILIMALISIASMSQCEGDLCQDAPTLNVDPTPSAITQMSISIGHPYAIGNPAWSYTCDWYCDETQSGIGGYGYTLDHTMWVWVHFPTDWHYCVILETGTPCPQIWNNGGFGYQMAIHSLGTDCNDVTNGVQEIIHNPTIDEGIYDMDYMFVDMGNIDAGNYLFMIDDLGGTCCEATLTVKSAPILGLPEFDSENPPNIESIKDEAPLCVRLDVLGREIHYPVSGVIYIEYLCNGDVRKVIYGD